MAASPTILPAQNSTLLKLVWENLEPSSCPCHYNFHMHTIASDGQLPPSTLIEQAVKIGLKGMAITDHHSIEGYRIAQNWLNNIQIQQPQLPLPHLWTGIEINADLLGIEIHVLAYAFEIEHPAIRPYLSGTSALGEHLFAQSVISAIHQAKGLAILAHPCRYQLPARELIPAAASLGIDGVETYYAYGNPKPWQPSSIQTREVLELSQKYRLYNTCGTDTHGFNLLHRI